MVSTTGYAKQARCAYCGAEAESVDHVVPGALYPSSKVSLPIRRITIPACIRCSQSWTNDEPELARMMLLAQPREHDRHAICPANDARVLRVVRKIVRGLCHHHGLLSRVSDAQVSADIQRFQLPPKILADMTFAHAEEDVLHYRYFVMDDPNVHSTWLLTFYGRTPFYCFVFRSPEASKRVGAVAA